MNVPLTKPSAVPDEQLWRLSREGDREAFGRIVARYQALVCSVAFSACGSLATSEDLAQETFIAAWRRLGDLREPDKLRNWLCGIARNLAANSVPAVICAGEALRLLWTLSQRKASPAEDPAAQAVTREEGDVALACSRRHATEIP
jgi:RNA polymerase sigma factor (sigma-70 family)